MKESMRIKTHTIICSLFCILSFLSGCDYSEQAIKPDSFFLFNEPIRLESLKAIKAPLIEGMSPPREESFQRSVLIDWVKWEYLGNQERIGITIRLYKHESNAVKDFHEAVKFRRHYRYDRKIEKPCCKIFISGVKALRGDMVPTRTGSYLSELILQSGNLLISIHESSPSENGDRKIKYIEAIEQEIRAALR